MVAVLGETTDPGQTMVELGRVLRPGGKLAITEQPGDPDAMEDTVVRALAEDAGLVYLNRHGSRKNFTVTFVRPMGDLPHASALDS